MGVQGFHHLAIQVHDLERVSAFYRDVLGLTEQARHRAEDGTVRSVWLQLEDGGFLALERVEGNPMGDDFKSPHLGLHLLALRIPRDERAAVLSRLKRLGVAVDHQSRWTVYVRDPEGNRIGLSHHPSDPLVP